MRMGMVILLTTIAACGGSGGDVEEVVLATFASPGDISNPDAGPEESANSVSDNNVPEIEVAGSHYSLLQALRIRRQDSPTHQHRELHLTDGIMGSTTIDLEGVAYDIWQPEIARLWLAINLYAPLDNSGITGSYRALTFAEIDSGAPPIGEYYFDDVRLGIDRNGDQAISAEDGEISDIVFGSIDIVAENDALRFIYTLVMENGVTISGNLMLPG